MNEQTVLGNTQIIVLGDFNDEMDDPQVVSFLVDKFLTFSQEEQTQFNSIKNNINELYINQGYDDSKKVTDMLDASKKILKDLGYNTWVGEE